MAVHDDVPTRKAILDGWLEGALTYDLELWVDRPTVDGAQEADFGGYAPVELAAADWAPAEDDGTKSTADEVDFGAPTSDNTGALRYWGLRNTATGVLAFSAALAAPMNVLEGDDHVLVPVTVFFA